MLLNTLFIVHEFLRNTVKPGSFCIDATAGKGRDTVLLSRLCGDTGRVMAFDIQKEAVDATNALLKAEGVSAEVYCDSHANMGKYAPSESVDCIVFNFGRLPGGDPKVFTRAESSIPAISEGLKLLKRGGCMAIALYYGGANGYGERDAILDYISTLDDRQYSVLCCDWKNRPNDPPMPIFIWKA